MNKGTPVSVSIDITIKDNVPVRFSRLIRTRSDRSEDVFVYCLCVLLEQDAHDEDEIKEATRIISKLTNHEDEHIVEGFNVFLKEVSDG